MVLYNPLLIRYGNGSVLIQITRFDGIEIYTVRQFLTCIGKSLKWNSTFYLAVNYITPAVKDHQVVLINLTVFGENRFELVVKLISIRCKGIRNPNQEVTEEFDRSANRIHTSVLRSNHQTNRNSLVRVHAMECM